MSKETRKKALVAELNESTKAYEDGQPYMRDIDWDGKRRRGNFTVFGKDIKTNDRDLGNYGGEIVIDDENLKLKMVSLIISA